MSIFELILQLSIFDISKFEVSIKAFEKCVCYCWKIKLIFVVIFEIKKKKLYYWFENKNYFESCNYFKFLQVHILSIFELFSKISILNISKFDFRSYSKNYFDKASKLEGF